MFNSIKSKLIIPITAVLVILMAVVVMYVTVQVNNLTDTLVDQRIELASHAAAAQLDEFAYQTELIARSVATDFTVISHLLEWNDHNDRPGNRQALIEHLQQVAQEMGVYSFVVRDFEGRIVLRMHDLPNYYDIDGAAGGVRALGGKTNSAFNSTDAMPMMISTNTPIRHDGQIIGVMSGIIRLDTTSFVDHFESIFNSRVTVFRSDTSVMSTSRTSDGGRAVGMQLVPEVVDQVNEGIPFVTNIVIGNTPYHAYYHPLVGAGGNVIGSIFLGFSNQIAYDATNQLQALLIVIGAVGVLVAAGLTFFVIAKSLKPLNALSKTVKEVASGNMNINLDSNLSKDEIGLLTADVHNLVKVVRNIVDDLINAYHQYIEVGDMHFIIDETQYLNSFKETIGLVNKLMSRNTEDLGHLREQLVLLGNGDFSVKMDMSAWPGEWAAYPKTVNRLSAGLVDVSTEINNMVKAAVELGDLHYRVDVSKYEGGWKDIMQGIDDIAEAVDKPVVEIRDAMAKMSQGEFFGAKVIGDYKGDFLAMRDSVNSMIETLNSYMMEIVEALDAISGGDLTKSITREFIGNFALLKEPINNISSTLNKTLSEISSAADQVLSGAKQISISAQELANGAQEQASSVEELNATIDIINQQTRQNAENAMEASEISNKSTSNAQEGNSSMKEMVSAMSQIKDSSSEISKIIKVIQNIAFQTNLLALNAAVEAARAGDHGKGFSVVAEEVRNLAGRSQTSATETTGLIETSNSRVESGSSIAEATSRSLNTIVENASEVSELIGRISASSQEQAEAIAQVSIGLAQISQVVQSNSAVSEETAAASEELNSQAEMLRQLVGYFRL